MNEALFVLEEFKANSFAFLGEFCDWMVETPVPFIFITLFLLLFICRVMKRYLL